MSSIVVIGSQWGDEGKGKLTDYFGDTADVVARFAGGDNAGHTVITNGKKIHLSLIPSGVMHPEKVGVLGNGMVINPASLLKELHYLKQNGVTGENLKISNRAQVLMPYHRLFDQLQEELKSNKIGTTKKGIGPAYMDKLERIGIRMADLIDKPVFAAKLKQALSIKNRILKGVFHHAPLDFQQIFDQYYAYGQKIKPWICDTSAFLNKALDEDKRVLFEGAQGSMLDIDHGTYPYVTSSNTVAGNAAVGTGVGPTRINKVIGVCKAYTSRVGAGPFPTELHNEIATKIRKAGHEWGVVTGRPRRLGWLDIVVLKHAVRASGITDLCLNCLDALSGIGDIKVCVGYDYKGQRLYNYPADNRVLEECQPVYKTFAGWDEDITNCEKVADLPENAQKYLKAVAKLVGVPLATFAVGASRDKIRELKDVWKEV